LLTSEKVGLGLDLDEDEIKNILKNGMAIGMYMKETDVVKSTKLQRELYDKGIDSKMLRTLESKFYAGNQDLLNRFTVGVASLYQYQTTQAWNEYISDIKLEGIDKLDDYFTENSPAALRKEYINDIKELAKVYKDPLAARRLLTSDEKRKHRIETLLRAFQERQIESPLIRNVRAIVTGLDIPMAGLGMAGVSPEMRKTEAFVDLMRKTQLAVIELGKTLKAQTDILQDLKKE